MSVNKKLIEALIRLEPADDPDESLKRLLLDKIRGELRKYDVIRQDFEKKYKMEFFAFKESGLMKEPTYEVEQDYFDWELAITRIDELREELQRLSNN